MKKDIKNYLEEKTYIEYVSFEDGHEYDVLGFTNKEYKAPDEIRDDVVDDIMDIAKRLAYKAYMSRTDEQEFRLIHKKDPKEVFEKWWKENSE